MEKSWGWVKNTKLIMHKKEVFHVYALNKMYILCIFKVYPCYINATILTQILQYHNISQITLYKTHFNFKNRLNVSK